MSFFKKETEVKCTNPFKKRIDCYILRTNFSLDAAQRESIQTLNCTYKVQNSSGWIISLTLIIYELDILRFSKWSASKQVIRSLKHWSRACSSHMTIMINIWVSPSQLVSRQRESISEWQVQRVSTVRGHGKSGYQAEKQQNNTQCDLWSFTYLKTWPNLKLCKKFRLGNVFLGIYDGVYAW
jgi:hypothetical protein